LRKDLGKAAELYQRAANQDFERAISQLKRLSGRRKCLGELPPLFSIVCDTSKPVRHQQRQAYGLMLRVVALSLPDVPNAAVTETV